jgi:hypothetical protein
MYSLSGEAVDKRQSLTLSRSGMIFLKVRLFPRPGLKGGRSRQAYLFSPLAKRPEGESTARPESMWTPDDFKGTHLEDPKQIAAWAACILMPGVRCELRVFFLAKQGRKGELLSFNQSDHD